MDQKLVLCMTSLKEEADVVRAGAVSSDLNALVADVFDLCKQAVSEEDEAFAIAVIFDTENGIFEVLELLMPVKERTVVKARESCCTFLAEFVEQIGDRVLPHVAVIKERCLSVFRRDDSKVVQAAALSPLLSMLESNVVQKNSNFFSVGWSMAEMLLQEYRKAKTSGTLKSNILILLGYLVEYFPAKFDEENVTKLVNTCLHTLDEQLRQTNKDPVFVLVSGAMKCVDSLLIWYDDSIPAKGFVENSTSLYTYLRQVICYREEIKRYETVKAGLRLLSRHAGIFAIRLVQDSKDILSWLQSYCTHPNALLRDAGFSAFNQFIYEVSQCLVNKDRKVQNAKSIYQHFMSTFFEILDAQYMDAKMLLSLAVKGLGRLSPAIVQFSGKETLQQVFHRLIPFGGSTSKSGEDKDYLLGHSDTLIGAFADIVIYLDHVEDYMVSFIAEVTGNIFYQFPQLFPKQKKAIILSLSMLFKALYLKGSIFSIFLANIVWSSLERTMESTESSGEPGLPLWPHYSELWSQILDASTQVAAWGVLVHEKDDECSEVFTGPDGEELKVDLHQLQEFIFDTIIRSIMKTLTELNLKYRVRAADKQKLSTSGVLQDDADAAAMEPETEMDMIEPLNLVDMHKYLNLVEFIQDFLSRPYAILFLKWVYPFGSFIMELSNQYPLISGHYKLLSVTIRNADAEGFFEYSGGSSSSECYSNSIQLEEDWDFLIGERSSAGNVSNLPSEQQILCKLLFRQYLHEVLVASRRYKLELLVSCLQLCLSAPPTLIDIGSLVVPMQTALKIGLRFPRLASVAMDGLERWHRLYPRKLELSLSDIVPSLSDYLAEIDSIEVSDALPSVDQSAESSTSPGGVVISGNLSRSQLARLRQTRAKENQPGPFEVIQLRVQKFLGKIGHFNHHLVPEVNLLQAVGSGGLAWDSVDRVQFTLPFRDEKYDVWLDSLLPRVVELALSSSDRRTKVTASELLQALCLIMLGNSAKGPVRRKNENSLSVRLDKIYKKLFPAILRLAVDVEVVTRQLFNEFAKQLIHWYTSNQQKENPETVALLDTILDGLVDAENGSLREFCAACFGEFMSWSVRHAPPETNDFVNVKSILRRLYNRMDHPNPYKRLGASMAAYRIYPFLRGTPSIVDRYIFEMIFFCIKSLRLAEGDDNQTGTVKQLSKTLDNYLKLVERNISVLQRARKDRPVFLTLENFLEWLLQQTWQLQEKCRAKCMSALSFICRSLPAGSLAGWFNSGSMQSTTISNRIKAFGFEVDNLSEKIENSLDEADHQLSLFVRSFHWFTWALKDKLVTVQELQMNAKGSLIVKTFLQGIIRVSESSSQWSAVTPGQREVHQKLKCSATIQFLRFVKQILDSEFGFLNKGLFLSRDVSKGTVDTGVLGDLIPAGEPKFHEVMCLALLRPRDLGFVMIDLQQSEELARLALGVMQMLTVVSDDFKLGLTGRLQAMFNENKQKYDLSAMNLSLDTLGNDGAIGLEDTISLLKGYQQLHLSGSLLPVLGKEEGKKMGENILMSVVGIGRECPPVLESVASEMLSLSIALGVKAQQLVEVCLDEKIITSSSSARKVTTGGVFYLNFRKVIVRQVKFSFEDCGVTLLNAALKKPTARLILNAVLDDYIGSMEHGTNLSLGSFLEVILSHLKIFQSCTTSSSDLADKQFLLEIFHKLLILDNSFDLLQEHQSALKFVEDTYISFLTVFHNPGDSITSSSSQSDANFALKSQSIVLVHYFFGPRFDQDLQSRIAGALTKVVSDHLLIRETDLHANSHQRNSYLLMLSRLLDSVSVSGSLTLLEIIFPLFLHPPKVAVRMLSETLDKLAERVGEEREGAFDLCIQILNDDTKLPRLKRAVVEKVFSALVKVAPVDFVASWYSSRIEAFVESIGKQGTNADPDKEEESLVSKICHYYLVELLFQKVDAPIIKEKITPLVSNALLMKQTMAESRAKNDPVKPFPTNSTLWRELHIAAYNCLAAIALRTQELEKIFSAVLFKEGPAGMIWQHLIDTDKVYNSFPVETSQLNLASQTVREMRAKQKARIRQQGNVSSSLSTLSSQYFAGAGLSQEPALINTFVSRGGLAESRSDTTSIRMSLNLGDDFGSAEETHVDPSSLKESDTVPEVLIDRLDLDQDDFDLHPCMPMVLRLIETLYIRFGAGREDMPEWMRALYSTMQNSATQMNVRLFLTKVLIKAWKVFTPYCRTWFLPMVQTILLDPAKSGGMNFHYMLRDICITILQWKFARPPDAGVASAFINHLMSVAAHGSTQVLRANVDIIRLFVGSWKEDLQLEKRIIFNYLCAGGKAVNSSDRVVRMQRIVGLQLLGAIVVSELPMYDPFRDQFSEKDLYHALLQNLSFKGKEVYEASGELLGIALKQRKETSQGSIAPQDEVVLEVPLKQCLLNFVRDSNLDCFLYILNKITLRFPPYIEGFASVLIDMLPKLPGVFKTIALDVFLRYPVCITNFMNMLLPSLNKLLTHRDEVAQLKSLQLLMELVKDGPDKKITERVIPVLCETFPTHESVDCRQQYYYILTSLYEREGVNTNRLIVRSLLAGLIDTADVIRLRIQTFWHVHLSQDLGHRLTQMINEMYDPAVEEYWAQFTNVLLLKLCEDSVDFKRPIFNAPLSDCEFHEHTINTSWSSSSLPMTPLFSQSQSVPQGSQESLSQVALSSQESSATNPREAHMIRATFLSTLTQTQDTMASSTQASQESALFAMSRKPARTQREATTQDSMTLDDSIVPRRRIFQSDAAKSQIIRGVMNANRRREARAKQQATERGNKVHMMRRYRIGELPDIEIKYEEILTPLAALAQNDATFARLLLTLICRAIYAHQRTPPLKNKHGDIKDSIKEGIEKALKITRNGISFVSCLEALCLEDSEIWIQPKLLGSASLKSTNFHSGIVVLEMEILHENSKDGTSPGTTTKRHKGAAGTPTKGEKTDLEEAWLELARLYSELGEDDVVLSLYRKNLTKNSITHKALEAQLGGDPSQGLILYDQALDTLCDDPGVSGIEQDIWYNQRLVCLADLNRWDLILADTVEQIKDEDESLGPDLRRLWDPNLKEPYLGLFMRGAVKVATYCSKAEDFVQSSSEDPGKRDILMNQYGSQLAQLAVVNDQLDRARFLLSNCYRHFRKQWSALHPLAVGARRRQLQKLQKMAELDEFTDVMAGRQLTEIPRILQEWRHRWPSSRDDGVEVWEDIVQNRLVFFHKFRGLVNNQLGSEPNVVKTTFASKLDEERAHIFRQAASSQTKQGAYSVAEKYMEEYIAARQGSKKKDKLDYESTKGLVKLQLLKANRIQTVQAGKATRMLNEVLSYVKSSARKPGVEEDSMIWMSFKLLEANASVQLAWSNLGCLPKTDPNPSAVKECLSLLGAAYMGYSEVFTNQSIGSECSVDPKTLRRLAKTSLKFGQFCDELLKSTKNEEWSNDVRAGIMEGDSATGLPPGSIYPPLIVKHMMKAATLDTSLRAQHGVARILSLVGQYPETHAAFPNQVKQVPSWVFIPWIPQMLAVMDQEEGKLFVGLLEEIARLHPHSLYYPFHVSEKDFGQVGQKRTLMLAKLLKNDHMQGFVRALEDLTFPEQRLRDGFAQIKNHLATSNREMAKAVFAGLVEDCLDVDVMCQASRKAGEYNCKFARDWSKRVKKALGDDGHKLLHLDEKGFMSAVKDLMANLQKAMQNLQTGVMSLAHLSIWMAKFDQSTSAPIIRQESGTFPSRTESSESDAELAIEIPGQYNGFHEPKHLSHVKLMGFDQTLISLSSKQRPKVLTMRGSDEKEYKFVVKGGEDIRLDQRIEQLFEVMNNILQRNSAASHRGLSIRTYAVVPVSKSCGLLQFVENTCVLEDVVKDGLISKLPELAREGKDAPTAFLQKLRALHHDWIQRRGGPSKSPYESFTNLYKKAGFDEITNMLTSIQSQLPWDTFRAGVTRWATSAESYLALRSQFAKSLSVVSICGYIAGVGDRHLANTLVDMRSGSLVPIDFGYSFGAGVILLPVPELIPFRLTNQLTNFLLPLDALGLLRTDMVHTLSALHQSRDIISSVMDVFVKEPLVDWKNEAMKTKSIRDKEGGSDEMEANLEQQYVELKVANAQRKLQLWNPAAITIAELQSSIHANKPYLPALEEIVRGNPGRNVRACITGDKCQSVQEQVDCLIDQAIDPNLLGRIWSGWQAWV